MTIQLNDLGQVYLVCGKTDRRQGIDWLAYLVKGQFGLDPVFLFSGGRKDRFKPFIGTDKDSACFTNGLSMEH